MDFLNKCKECWKVSFILLQGTRYTIEYLVKVVSKLKPLREQAVFNLYEKLLSHLTHQWVSYDSDDSDHSWVQAAMSSEMSEEKDHWGIMKLSEAEKLFSFFQNLQEELGARRHSIKKRHWWWKLVFRTGSGLQWFV